MKKNEKLNLGYAVESIVKAYQGGVFLDGDADDVESCIIDALDQECNIISGSSLIIDFNELGFNENLLNTILRSIQDYPECNEPLVKGYSDCWWLLDNGSDNSLETFCYESDWMERCTELFLDEYDYDESIVKIFTERLDIEALVQEYELEVESDDDE